jgi:hypothetical protein
MIDLKERCKVTKKAAKQENRIIDFFHRANIQNMQMIQGFVDGDEAIIKQVNQRALQSAIVLVILLLLIALMIWALVSFGSYLYSTVASLF